MTIEEVAVALLNILIKDFTLLADGSKLRTRHEAILHTVMKLHQQVQATVMDRCQEASIRSIRP